MKVTVVVCQVQGHGRVVVLAGEVEENDAVTRAVLQLAYPMTQPEADISMTAATAIEHVRETTWFTVEVVEVLGA